MRGRSVLAAGIALFALCDAPKLRSQVTVGTWSFGDCIPFSCLNAGDRYQQLYAASAFPGPMTITGLTFFLDPSANPPGSSIQLGPGVFDIYLAISNRPIGGLTTNLDFNVSSGEQLFFAAGLPSGGMSTSFTIFGDPFVYNPALGNLLLEVVASQTSVGGSFLKAGANETDTESATCSTPFGGLGGGCVAGAGQSALVTQFVTTPEPQTLWLVGTGLVLAAAYSRRSKHSRRS